MDFILSRQVQILPQEGYQFMADRTDLLENLIKGYAPYYDVEYAKDDKLPLVARCTFHVHSEKYVLTKKAVLWDADSHEHVFVFSLPHLTKELYEECRDAVYEKGMALIDPKPGHMYTYLTTVFLCDSCDPEARKELRRCRLHKNFRFSLYGWMDFHTALVDLKQKKIDTNSSGHANAKFLKKLLRATN